MHTGKHVICYIVQTILFTPSLIGQSPAVHKLFTVQEA